MKNIAYIQARGGSKTIPLKNIKDFCGKPLVMWIAEEASKAKSIDMVFVATDHDKIYQTVKKHGNEKIMPILTREITDYELQEEVMVSFAKDTAFENIMLMQATTPYTTAKDIDGAFEKYKNYDGIVSVVRQHRFLWDDSKEHAVPINYDLQHRQRRQDWGGLLVENGAFFITSKEALLRTECRLSGKIGIYEMSAESYFEIDDETDWIIAENLFKRRL